MNIQELLNNDTIKTNDILKLAADTTLLRSTLAELDKTNLTLIEMKDCLAEFHKDMYDLAGLREKYNTLKKYREMNPSLFEGSEYSLKVYLNGRFSMDLCSLSDPISDDPFFTDLYYHPEDDYSVLEMLNDRIGYDNPKDCLSIEAMIYYFRDAYEATIDYINEGIEYTLKMKDILSKLSDILENNKNVATILKMAAM